jgi:hypothetical protein
MACILCYTYGPMLCPSSLTGNSDNAQPLRGVLSVIHVRTIKAAVKSIGARRLNLTTANNHPNPEFIVSTSVYERPSSCD